MRKFTSHNSAYTDSYPMHADTVIYYIILTNLFHIQSQGFNTLRYKLMSSANRHISFFNYSEPPCPILFKQASLVLWQIYPIYTMYGVPRKFIFEVKLAIIKTRIALHS